MSTTGEAPGGTRGRRPLLRWGVPLAVLAIAGTLVFTFRELTSSPAPATHAVAVTGRMTVSVAADGAYTVSLPAPGWRFGGGVGAPVADVATDRGSDAAGAYQEVTFTYTAGTLRRAGIRTYESRAAVVFTDVRPAAGANTAPFPRLTTVPSGLVHIAYPDAFAGYSFSRLDAHGPVTFVDGANDAFIVSPASDFMTATTVDDHGVLEGAIDSRITTLPAQTAHATLLVAGHGVNAVYDAWGATLMALRGTSHPAATDPTVRQLGYWTDNGATYYYHFDPSLGYERTLLAVRDEFRRSGIRLGYMQLDSWWYPKGPSAAWDDHGDGIATYQAAAQLFPDGLAAFQRRLGLPLAVHARWIDATSPYRTRYRMSGNVVVDPAYWNDRAAYLAASGVVMFEQDWLDHRATTALDLTDPYAFLGDMATAMQGRGLTVQYCLALSRHLLQSLDYPPLTTVRVSGDHFGRDHWDAFLYDSRLAAAVGLRPWSDVFTSAETMNLLLSTLSTGPVGVGDALGKVKPENLLHAVRRDGVIVKPDAPLLPVDAMYDPAAASDRRPMVATTVSDHGAMRTLYTVAYARGGGTQASFVPAAGSSGEVYVDDWFGDSGAVVPAASTVTRTVGPEGAYFVTVPVGPSGIAFVGDVDQFVSMGQQRITDVRDDGGVHATVAFATGETSVTLGGHAPSPPRATASDGTVTAATWDAASGRFRITVAPGADGRAVVTLRLR